MSRARKSTPAVARTDVRALPPQGVNLLPASVHAAQDARRLRRRLGAGLVAFVVLLGGVQGVLLMVDDQAQRELDLALTEGIRLQDDMARYAEAADVRAAITQVSDARRLGMGTEIRWVDMIRQIESVSPPGTKMASFSAQSLAPAEGSVFTAPDQLASPGVATISFRVETPTLPDTAAWLEALNAIPGLMDASFSTVSLSGGAAEDGEAEVYVVTSSVQVNVVALSGTHIDLGTREEAS